MANRKRMLIVDGYNVLNFGWPGLLGKQIDDARDKLIDQLHDYAGYSDQTVVAVFDAWRSDRMERSSQTHGKLTVTFTRRLETADQYIERLCEQHRRDAELGKLEMRVATSDLVEQTLIFGRGATRMSARELLSEMEGMRTAGIKSAKPKITAKATVMDGLPAGVREKLEQLRRGNG